MKVWTWEERESQLNVKRYKSVRLNCLQPAGQEGMKFSRRIMDENKRSIVDRLLQTELS